jgi:hypothetical protein
MSCSCSLVLPLRKRNHLPASRIGVPNPDSLSTQNVLNFPPGFDRNPCTCFWRIGIGAPSDLQAVHHYEPVLRPSGWLSNRLHCDLPHHCSHPYWRRPPTALRLAISSSTITDRLSTSQSSSPWNYNSLISSHPTDVFLREYLTFPLLASNALIAGRRSARPRASCGCRGRSSLSVLLYSVNDQVQTHRRSLPPRREAHPPVTLMWRASAGRRWRRSMMKSWPLGLREIASSMAA